MKIKFKRYACHANAQVPVTLALDLKAKHGISGDDVARIALAVNEKSLSHHNIPEPADLAMAQYSVGHPARVAEIQARVAKLPGLHLAGNAYLGIGIPDCIRTAQLAAARITGRVETPAPVGISRR